VESYLASLTDCFILHKAGRYDVKGKQFLNPKYLLTLDDDPPASYNGIQRINALDWLLKG
jgi:hypothetical protein